MGYPHIYISLGLGQSKKCTKISGNTSRVSPRDEVVKNARNAGCILKPGLKVDLWTAERCLYANKRKSGSFLPIAGWS